jgi:hypothetical protein
MSTHHQVALGSGISTMNRVRTRSRAREHDRPRDPDRRDVEIPHRPRHSLRLESVEHRSPDKLYPIMHIMSGNVDGALLPACSPPAKAGRWSVRARCWRVVRSLHRGVDSRGQAAEEITDGWGDSAGRARAAHKRNRSVACQLRPGRTALGVRSTTDGESSRFVVAVRTPAMAAPAAPGHVLGPGHSPSLSRFPDRGSHAERGAARNTAWGRNAAPAPTL